MKPICVFWKTSRNAKASPARGGGIERSEDVGEVVRSSTCVIPLTRKASFVVQPLRRWRASSPGRGALGKEVSFSMKPTCVCRKTSRNAKASHFERLPRPGEVARKCQKGTRWHGEAVTERARMLTKNKKHSDTHPACQSHRIAVLSCFILPGLPSQALARQLSQRESPWQGGQALVYASMPWSAGG